MAIVQKTSNSESGAANITPSLTGVTAGNALVLLISAHGMTDTTPTDTSGQTWSKAYFYTNGSGEIACYYLLSANSGTHTVTKTAGGAVDASYSLIEIPACSAIDVTGTAGTGVNTITTLSAPSITTTNANDAVIAVFCADTATGSSNAAITDPPTGYTSIFAQQGTSTAVGAEFGYKEVSSTGSQAATWTFNADTSGSQYLAAMVSFKLSATGAAFGGPGVATAVGSATLVGKAQLAGAGTATARGQASLSTASGGLGGAGVASATGSATLTAKAQLGGAGLAAAAGSATLSALTPVITLKQYWLKNWQTGTTAATLQVGSNPMTVTAGSTLIAVWSGWEGGAIAAPVISSGSFTTPTNGAQFDGVHLNLAIAYQANAAGGSVTTTAPNVAAGNSGEVAVWIYEVTNMPATAVVRNCAGAHVSSSVQSWSQSSDSSPQVGDLVFAATMYENSVTLTNAGLTDPPSGWTSQGVNQDATNFVPTEICSRVVSSAGVQTASWSNADTHTTDHFTVMLTMQTSAQTGATFAGAGQALGAGSATLTAMAQLGGAGAVSANGSAAFAARAAFSGGGSANAVGAIAMVAQAAFSGAGSVVALGASSMAAKAALAGASTASAAGQATLTAGGAGANFGGAGVAAANGVVALNVSATFGGTGSTVVAGAATLTITPVGASFSATAYANASAAAALVARSQFVGSGTARALGSAALTIPSPFAPGNLSVWLVPARRTVAHVPARQIVAQATD